MNVYILLDENNIVRCVASEECNLHKNKLYMKKYYVKAGKGVVGDEYDPKTDLWISRPENYPQPTKAETQQALVEERKNKIIENQAIAELIAEGSLPPDYTGDDNA